MTEAQAHRFLSRWRRHLSRNKKAVSVAGLRGECLGVIYGLLAPLALAAVGCFTAKGGWLCFDVTLVVYCLLSMAFSAWVLIRLRQARIALKLPAWRDLALTFSSGPAPR